jgi:hypothetical protein
MSGNMINYYATMPSDEGYSDLIAVDMDGQILYSKSGFLKSISPYFFREGNAGMGYTSITDGDAVFCIQTTYEELPLDSVVVEIDEEDLPRYIR